MQAFFSTKHLDRYHAYAPTKEYLDQLVEKFDLHEIIEEDILDATVQDKIDVYDNCLFLVLHFPKYKKERGKYIINEFNIIVGKGWLVTLTKYKTDHIDVIKQAYGEQMKTLESDEQFKLSPYYILYELIDAMYDKVLIWLRYFSKDLRMIEDKVFDAHTMDKASLEQIMLKRRNIVTLKHMLKPQEELLDELEHDNGIKQFWWEELEVYFEDLQYKLDRIMGQITVISEDIDSLYDTYNAMVNMKLNSIITILTVFTVILWVLTLVTWYYGMNIDLPVAADPRAFMYVLWWMGLIATIMIVLFRWKKWI